MTVLAQALSAGLLSVALLASLPSQEYVRWLDDLGDEQLSEAAERSLINLGAGAVRPLSEQLAKWDTSTPRERERCLALLRVISLLGADAAALAPDVKQCGKQKPSPLLAQIVNTLASLEPYAGDTVWHELFHHAVSAEDNKGPLMNSFLRLISRLGIYTNRVFDPSDAPALRALLAKDEFGSREVAAAALAKLDDKPTIDALHKRLLNRDVQPKGWDQLQHNGFVVPIEDEFSLRGAQALVTLAPTDPRAAIGYANMALHHPHASVRLESLRHMAQLGPAARDAIPELLSLAKGDQALAIEALKLLGMAGTAVGDHLTTIDALADKDNGAASRIAKGLAARLRAMGCESSSTAAADDTNHQELARLVAALDDTTDAAVIAKLAATATAWPLLKQRFGAEGKQATHAVFDVIAQLGWLVSEEERTNMRYCVAMVGSERWDASMMSTMTGGPGLDEIHHRTYAHLQVSPSATPVELASLLLDDNPYVRRVALQSLRQQRLLSGNEAEQDGEPSKAVRAALLQAATGKHPKKFQLEHGPHSKSGMRADIEDELQTEAAEQLVAFEVRSPKLAELLTALMRSKHEDKIVAALGNWSNEGGQSSSKALAQLKSIATDKRPAVAAAAKAALARLKAK